MISLSRLATKYCFSPHVLIVMLAVLGTVFFSPTVRARTTFTVGVYENKPLIFTDESGAVAGIFPEILEDIATRKGWKIEYRSASWHTLLDRVANGTIDLLPAIAYSDERAQRLSFSDETILVNWAEAYTSGNRSLSSLLDLEGQRVAVKEGDIHYQALRELTKKFGIQCRFIETDEYQTIFEMLDANYLDIGIVNRLFGDANKKAFSVQVTPVIFNPIELRFASAKGHHLDALFAIDQHIRRQKQDPDSVYHLSMAKWLASTPASRISGYLLYTVSGLGAAFVLLVSISLLLRHQVTRQTATLTSTNQHLKEEIRKRQHTLQELKKYVRVVEASTDGVALFDHDHIHLLVNSSYLSIFNVERNSLQGKNLARVVGRDHFDKILQPYISRALDGEQVTCITNRVSDDGTLTHLSIQFGPYTVSDNFILGYTMDIRDITQQVELQNQLKQAQKMEAIGLLAGGVAHDLNNILSGLVSYPDLLLVNRDEDDPMYRPLKLIRSSGERAAAIVSDLLTLARRGVDNLQPVNFNSIITDFIDSPEYADLLAGTSNIEVRFQLDDDLLNIVGSRLHLTKCVMNLFTNSLEAMPRGGVLTIATLNRYLEEHELPNAELHAGDHVLLRVVDTGLGMDRQTMHRIFEPFYTSKVMGRSGTGLGMTLVWNAVRDHHGHVAVTSNPGEGTTFTLYFPATLLKAAATDKHSHHQYPGHGEEVLVIDDMGEQRRLAEEMLTMLGYRVDTATSGEDAIEMAHRHSYDLLLLDMIMPNGMDGLTTYKKILAQNPGQKAVIASGFSEAAAIDQALALGASELVKKPYSVYALAAAIHRALQEPAGPSA